MLIRSLVCVILFITLAGCISTKRTTTITTVYDNVTVASKKVKPIVSLNYGTSERILIEKGVSPRIKLDLEGKIDYFEVILIEGKKGQPFNLEVSAICDCLGFRKWGIIPDSILISPDGKSIGAKKATISQIHHTGFFPADGKYKLIVIAKSEFTGQKIGSVEGALPNASTISLPVRVHPTGTVIIWWSENNI